MDEILNGAFAPETESAPLEAEIATVSAIAENGLELIFDGADESDRKVYPCNACVEFRVGDRVIVRKISGTYIAEYPLGAPGSRGGGESILPAGGAAGYVLGKKTAADYDTEWKAIFPSGGTDGQVLTKDGTTAQRVKWAAAPGGEVDKLVNGNYTAALDDKGNVVPKSTSVRGALGTSALPWNGVHAVGSVDLAGNDVGICSNVYNAKLGFFGIATKQSKLTHSTSSNNMGYSTVTSSNLSSTGVYALNNLIGILKKYGLIA